MNKFVSLNKDVNDSYNSGIHFHRTELGPIISLYGRMVAAGEWRDYGISSLKEVAIFSIFRRAAEHPIYTIEKRPKLKGKQGMYSVVGMDGHILKRGSDLKVVPNTHLRANETVLDFVCRLLLEKKKKKKNINETTRV